MDRGKRGKPRVHEEEGVKDGDNPEDSWRQDKRPRPVGPATAGIDEAMADGVIEPDPETPSQTPRE